MCIFLWVSENDLLLDSVSDIYDMTVPKRRRTILSDADGAGEAVPASISEFGDVGDDILQKFGDALDRCANAKA